jgi:GT2 family glycosyltransferase
LTYVIDLERLWADRGVSATNQHKANSIYLDPRQNVVSAIVVADSDEMKLMLTLQALLTQLFIRELIVVNCESNPALDRFLAKFATLNPKCYVVHGQKNMGLAAAYNLGAQYASGQFLLFLESTCVLEKNAVLEMLSTGIRKPLPWIIGAEDESCHNPKAAMTWLQAMHAWLNTSKTKEKLHHTSMREVSLPGGGFHVSNLASGCLFMPSKSFLELKGWDKQCFHTTFHYDLCLRVHLAGGGVYRAKELAFIQQARPKMTLKKGLALAWQACVGWQHYYNKYVRKSTNICALGLLQGLVLMRFFTGCCLLFSEKFFSKFIKSPSLFKGSPSRTCS